MSTEKIELLEERFLYLKDTQSGVVRHFDKKRKKDMRLYEHCKYAKKIIKGRKPGTLIEHGEKWIEATKEDFEAQKSILPISAEDLSIAKKEAGKRHKEMMAQIKVEMAAELKDEMKELKANLKAEMEAELRAEMEANKVVDDKETKTKKK